MAIQTERIEQQKSRFVSSRCLYSSLKDTRPSSFISIIWIFFAKSIPPSPPATCPAHGRLNWSCCGTSEMTDSPGDRTSAVAMALISGGSSIPQHRCCQLASSLLIAPELSTSYSRKHICNLSTKVPLQRQESQQQTCRPATSATHMAVV